MALNTRNAIVAVLLLVVMVSTPAVTAQEDCWDKCFKDCKAKMAMEVCNQKCIDFCKSFVKEKNSAREVLMVQGVDSANTLLAAAAFAKERQSEPATANPEFLYLQTGAGEYVKMAGDKLKETKTASPEQATKLKNEATTYLERAKVLSDKAVTP
ncbi:uncharacterized protein LOC119296995 [Triticum dicoccoides]|uniref:uncharacterized protein LOC119296995 n=1 Tax=Triticum dicoccoides TaxID=85692 RepID=UPI00188DE95E|nr:uncharacterized protein LOC119296995 [Triticum dicoccoides]